MIHNLEDSLEKWHEEILCSKVHLQAWEIKFSIISFPYAAIMSDRR